MLVQLVLLFQKCRYSRYFWPQIWCCSSWLGNTNQVLLTTSSQICLVSPKTKQAASIIEVCFLPAICDENYFKIIELNIGAMAQLGNWCLKHVWNLKLMKAHSQAVSGRDVVVAPPIKRRGGKWRKICGAEWSQRGTTAACAILSLRPPLFPGPPSYILDIERIIFMLTVCYERNSALSYGVRPALFPSPTWSPLN